MEVRYETFAFQDDQFDIVWAALARAQDLAEKNLPKSALLALVCMDFLATNDFRKGASDENTARFLARVEAALGVKIVAVDMRTNSVKYGVDTISALIGDDDAS